MGEAISSQVLAPHTPEEGLVAFFFYAWSPCRSRQKPTDVEPKDGPEQWSALQTAAKPPNVCYRSSRAHPMTDYSTAIFGLIAFIGVVSAAVVYILAQPSDLPVVKKAKAAKS